MERGFFCSLFDLDRDGQLDVEERALEFIAFEEMCHEDEEEDMFEMSRLSCGELDYMDEDERREALEEAGLEPDDFDF